VSAVRRAPVLVAVALATVAVAVGVWWSRRGGTEDGPTPGVATRWFPDALPDDADRTVLLTSADEPPPCGDDCPFDRVVSGAEGRDGIAAVLAAVSAAMENLGTFDEASADAKRAIARTHRALDVRLRHGRGGPPLYALVVARAPASRAKGALGPRAVLVFDHGHPRLDASARAEGRSGARLLLTRRSSPSGDVAGTIEVAESAPGGNESVADLPDWAESLRPPAPSIVPAPADAPYRRLGIALRDDGRVAAYGARVASPDASAPALEAALARILSGL
jgi:hypothetical protein